MDGMAAARPGDGKIALDMGDIRRTYSSGSFKRGVEYYRQGRVKVTHVSADGSAIEGRVRGSMRYDVAVSIEPDDGGGVGIISDCTCPLGGDCKHAVALLCAYTADPALLSPPARHAPAPKVPQPQVKALPHQVTQWLAGVRQAAAHTGEDYPPGLRQRLFYLLDVVADWQGAARPSVSASSVRLLSTGALADTATLLDPARLVGSGVPPKYFRPSDLSILPLLARFERAPANGTVFLDGAEGSDALARILATGRGRWQSVKGAVLSAAAARSGRLGWSLDLRGGHRLRADAGPGRVALGLRRPWYVDPATGECGHLDLGIDQPLVEALLRSPSLSSEHVGAVQAALGEAVPGLALPPAPPPALRIATPPQPVMRLFCQRGISSTYWRVKGKYRAPAETATIAFARLHFRYDGHDVPVNEDRDVFTKVAGGRLIEIHRDQTAEREARDLLLEAGLQGAASHPSIWGIDAKNRDALTFCAEAPVADSMWLEFLANQVPRLRALDWHIEIDADFPHVLVQADGEFEATLDGGSGIDWFDLGIGALLDGVRVDILPPLLRVLREGTEAELAPFLDDGDADAKLIVLRLDDGRYMQAPLARVRPILKALTGLFNAPLDNGPLRVGRADAAALSEFADAAGAGLAWRGGEKLRALGQKLREAEGIPPVAVPSLFEGRLRPYQASGVGWMQLLREVELGGVLADDMGLGKTVQTLAHLAIEKAEGRADRPSLIVAPTSVLPNWRSEIAAFTPGLSVLWLHGLGRKASFAALGETDIVLTTYALLPRDIEVLSAQAWHVVIADEAQAVKNPATAAAQALRRLQARHRLALTGTPLENHLGELWALFDFVSPGFLGDARAFTKAWRAPIEKKGDRERQAALARRCKPFLLRRTKALVAADLPPKTEIIEHIELEKAQRDLYESIRLAMNKKVRQAIAAKGLNRSRIEFLDALLKLRQACCDPRLVKTAGRAASGSAKLSRLMEMLPALRAEGRRVLLFSQFTSMLALIEAELGRMGMDYVMLTGDTVDRVTPVRRFQAGEVGLFLISLKAGGTGLNLTAADTVIHYDPWWNPAVEAQATDRAHRIGQDKPVFVHKLVAEGTIEVKMAVLAARKRSLADGIYAENAGGGFSFSEDDVSFLLGGA
jgi:superfamily II DNA or RNA helicase